MSTFLLILAWVSFASAIMCSFAAVGASVAGNNDMAHNLNLRSGIWTIATALLFIAERGA